MRDTPGSTSARPILAGLLALGVWALLPAPTAAQAERTKLLAGDAAPAATFGFATTVRGDHALVGAQQDGHAGDDSGSAYLFYRDDGGTPADPTDDTWAERLKLIATDAVAASSFGKSVALGADHAIIGAYRDDEWAVDAGAVYVFARDDKGTPDEFGDDSWTEQVKLVPADVATESSFGNSVSFNGDHLLVGAEADDGVGPNAGAAYVFVRDDNGTPADPADDVWSEQAKLTASDAENFSFFGNSVAISADHAVIGAHRKNSAGADAGAAYVFRRDDNGTPTMPADDSWIEQAVLVASDPETLDEFGTWVSISGDTLAVGSPFDDDECPAFSICNSGAVYVFDRDDNDTPTDPVDDAWVERAKLLASDPAFKDDFGAAVSLDGDQLLVGKRHDGAGGYESGAAYLFRRGDAGSPADRTDDTWIEQAKLVAADPEIDDHFGYSVALDGSNAIVGTPRDADNGDSAGSAYMFWIARGPWTWLGKPLSGSQGEPRLRAYGTLEGDTNVTFALDNAAPLTGFGLVIGLAELNAPFGGGTLVPTLDVEIYGFSTDAAGRFAAGGVWPTGIPAGFASVHQWWLVDPGGVQGWAATNALKATAP